MSFVVPISNRQRRVSVDTDWLHTVTDSLAAAICENLLTQRPKHLARSTIEQIAGRGNMSLVLVSDRAIRVLNRQWRGKDNATDVLSFPLELDAPPAGLPWQFGEIIISVERAVEQAQAYGHSLERELAFLFVHGCLHVFGFDHENPAEEKEMFGRQKEILSAVGLSR